jgi:hypothetical protein
MKLLPTRRKKKVKPVTWAQRKGTCKGGGQSSKAKGRIAVATVRELLIQYLGLGEADVFVKATSQGGCDIHLSAMGRECFPYSIEVKNVEALNIWKALTQAKNNADELSPIVFFKRARTPMFVALPAEEFLALLGRR